MLVTVVVGASVAGAQTVSQSSTRNNDVKDRPEPIGWDQRIDELKLIDDADYNAWKTYMVANGREVLAEKVTAEEFAKMAQLYDALKASDYTKAKEIAKDLKMPGLGLGMGRHGRMQPKILNSPLFKTLKPEVQDQLKAAEKAGDREKVREILEANGIKPKMGMMKGKFKNMMSTDDNDTLDQQ